MPRWSKHRRKKVLITIRIKQSIITKILTKMKADNKTKTQVVEEVLESYCWPKKRKML